MKLSRRGRWAVPAAAVVVAAGVIAGSQITIAQAAPELPARTPAQLLAQVSSHAKPPPLTGTVVETTSLGLPQLPQAGNPTSLSSLLTGSHTVKVYYDSARHFRLQVPQSLSETDVIRDGSTLWQWESTRNAVTEYTLPKSSPQQPAASASLPAVPALTPQQAASQLLKAVGKTTKVSVQRNVLVAGEPAYQLVLAPRDSRSLIGQVVIALDGKYGVPLRVQVFAKGATTPAFQVGYTQIDFVTPAAANLQFTPPPGATVRKVNAGSGQAAQSSGTSAGTPAASGFATFGSGWLTVAQFPQSDLTSGGPAGQPATGTQPTAGAGAGLGALSGDSQAVIQALIHAAKPVQGSWGTGTLLTTSLMSVLITNGQVYAGAVKPGVLYAAAGHTTG